MATRALYRTILMYGFHLLVMILCTRQIKDTQCGFKLFTRQAARYLFSHLHLERWSFDTELIYLAETASTESLSLFLPSPSQIPLSIPLSEIAVRWHEVDGSKLIQSKWDVVTTSLTMARDMLCVRLSYLLGIWNTRRKRGVKARAGDSQPVEKKDQ